MASHQQPSPTTGMPPHHAAAHLGHPQPNGHPPQMNAPKTPSQYLAQLTETVWNQIGMPCYYQPSGSTLLSTNALQVACRSRCKTWTVPTNAMNKLSSTINGLCPP